MAVAGEQDGARRRRTGHQPIGQGQQGIAGKEQVIERGHEVRRLARLVHVGLELQRGGRAIEARQLRDAIGTQQHPDAPRVRQDRTHEAKVALERLIEHQRAETALGMRPVKAVHVAQGNEHGQHRPRRFA